MGPKERVALLQGQLHRLLYEGLTKRRRLIRLSRVRRAGHPSAAPVRVMMSVLLGICLSALFPLPLNAQNAPAVPADQQSSANDVAARRLLADQLMVLMSQTLAGQDKPRPDQLQRAQVLLDMALTLNPHEAGRWRLRAELAKLMSDPRGRQNALRQYVKLEPKDDAAQLQLIYSHLDAVQTLEKRLQQVEVILKSRSGRQFSRPLRSRLATYAAKAANELGQRDLFTVWLQQALSLDPANTQAAAMAYHLALQQGASVAPLGTTAINRVAAAPANPQARLDLAEILLSQGVYRRAADQYEIAHTLALQPLPNDAYANWALCRAALGEDAQALSMLEQLESKPTDQSAEGQGRLPASLELLRLTILQSAQQQSQAAETSYQRLRAQLRQPLERATQAHAEQQGDNAQAAASVAVLQAKADVAWAALLFDHDVDAAANLVRDLAEAVHNGENGPVADRLQRLQGWLALRRGQMDQARQILEKQSANDVFATLGLAEAALNPENRLRWLNKTLEQSPGSLAGLLAARQLRHDHMPINLTRTGTLLLARMDDHPGHLWKPALTISPWVDFTLSVQPGTLDYLEPLHAELTIRNASQMPLALETNEGVPTRVLLAVSPKIEGQTLKQPQPLVVDIDRRLTLGVGESMNVPVRLDRDESGTVLAHQPFDTVTLDVTAVLGPRLTRGGFTPVPEGGTARARAIEVRGQAVTQTNIEQWIQAVQHGDTTASMHALARLTQVLGHLPADLDNAQMRQRIGEAVNEAFVREGPLGRAWVARFVPDTDQTRELFNDVIHRLQRSDEPLVRIVYMITHVKDKNDPLLTASLRHDNRTIRAFAEALRTGLTAETKAQTQPMEQGK